MISRPALPVNSNGAWRNFFLRFLKKGGEELSKGGVAFGSKRSFVVGKEYLAERPSCLSLLLGLLHFVKRLLKITYTLGRLCFLRIFVKI